MLSVKQKDIVVGNASILITNWLAWHLLGAQNFVWDTQNIGKIKMLVVISIDLSWRRRDCVAILLRQ